ncbi:MAG TPA: TonB family protein [Terriglobia bacterium]|jgi:TonB family protein
MPKRALAFAILSIFVLAGIESSAFAALQDQNAELAGIITDAFSTDLPAVAVTATNLETAVRRVTLTNSGGIYRFRSIVPGKYRLSATLPGFRPRVYNSVSLALSQHAQLHFALLPSPDSSPLPETSDAPAVLQELQPQLFAEPAPSSSPRIRVAGSDMDERLVGRVPPIYPVEARAARIVGAVILEVEVSSGGIVGNVRIVSGNPLLRQAAIEAVKRRFYRPVMLNGNPVDVITTVTVNVPE